MVLAAAVAGVLPAASTMAQLGEGSATTAGATTKPAADVPVRAVALFSSGVGYFEHFGTVKGDGSTELRFKTEQINDILKSLVLQDLDGGRVSTITYPSQDPISKTLKSFQVDITGNPPLADLLNQLRGATVQVLFGTEELRGVVLGVEEKQQKVGDGDGAEVVKTHVLNLLQGGTIRSIPLPEVRTLTLDDPELQEELTRALTALAQARDQDKKPVQINFMGDGDRRVRLGYVVETPIWKTSYRLILDARKPDEKNSAATQPAADGKLQGWAIVENQTDNDWNNIQLSLVSGRPISFVMDLYQPLYIPRPVVQPELYASLRPQTYDDGLREAKEAEAFARQEQPGRTLSRAARAPAAAASPPAAADMVSGAAAETAMELRDAMNVTASVQSIASAAKVGELFQYTVGNVSLPRQTSAMIPIITDDVEVERLSIYNANVLAKNPLNGARVKNTTGKHLLQGPITVIDGNTYAGDAKIDNLPPGQERLLSYGIDLQMLVNSTNQKTDNALLTGKIVKGVLHLQRKHVFTQDYLAENKSDRDKTMIIEHPFRQNWKLVDTEKPIETTDTLYRFKGTVGAGKTSKLTVREEIVQGETIAILPADLGQLLQYSRAGEIPEPVKKELQKAIELKQKLVVTQRQIDERQKDLNEISQEQNRIRENLKTIRENTPYYTRLMTKLNDQESKIETLQSEIEELTAQLNQQREELEQFVSNLNVG
jgi:hypothetical protein